MSKISKYIDIVLLSFLGILLIDAVVRHFLAGFVLTINLYLGIIFWFIVLALRITKNKRTKVYLIGIVLLAALNIISFTVENFSFGNGNIREYGPIYFVIPGINPIFLLLLVIFSLIDYKFSIDFYRRTLKGSDKERSEEYIKQMNFYYGQFSACNKNELDFAIENLKEYPEPAQEALQIIISEIRSGETKFLKG